LFFAWKKEAIENMPLLIIGALGSILVYFGMGFLLSYYTMSDNLAINKACRVLSAWFALFVLGYVLRAPLSPAK
jgi:type IV secretory pathway TrbL component